MAAESRASVASVVPPGMKTPAPRNASALPKCGSAAMSVRRDAQTTIRSGKSVNEWLCQEKVIIRRDSVHSTSIDMMVDRDLTFGQDASTALVALKRRAQADVSSAGSQWPA